MREVKQLLKLQSTGRFDSARGFALSLDAFMALILIMSLVAFGRVVTFETTASDNLIKMQTLQRADDVFTALINTGTLWNMIDEDGFNDTTAGGIHAKMAEMLPESVDFGITIRRYDVNIDPCRENKTFEACFPTEWMKEIKAGMVMPSKREMVHGRRVFVKKDPIGECEFDNGTELASADICPDRHGIIFFQDGDSNSDINFSVSVTPDDKLLCDEYAYVHLGMSVGGGDRYPIDLAIVMDKSLSMHGYGAKNGYTMWDRDVLGGSFDEGTRECSWWFWGWCWGGWDYDNWQNLGEFEVDGNQTFRAYLEYTGYGGSSSPKIKLTSPSDSNYGGNYDYVEIAYPAEEGTWTAWGWSDDWIDYDVNIFYTKMDVARDSAQYFVELAEWKAEDQLALVSYNEDADVDEHLTTDRVAVWLAIEDLEAGGNTATGEAIYTATNELINGGAANPEAMKFQVLLSDGRTNSGRSSGDAAKDANTNGITIYTIGLGEDADETELRNIAEITGGQYYYAADENALKDLYEIIAGSIGEAAVGGGEVEDVVVTMPVPDGTIVTDPGGGTFVEGVDQNFLIFNIGEITSDVPWEDDYVLVFPCSNSNNCENTWKVFPEEETYVSYTDQNGDPQIVNWDVNIVIDFLYRDLTVKIIGGDIVAENEVYLDINAQNIGYLDAVETTVKFYLGGTGEEGGIYLTERDIKALCTGQDSECNENHETIYDIRLDAVGYIYAIINEDKENAECPNNNVDVIRCYEWGKTQYFTFEYWMWLK